MSFMVTVHRRAGLVAALLAAVVILTGLSAPTRAAAADPDDEGGTTTLREQLNAASKGYVDAVAALEQSQKRQKELATQLTMLEKELATRSETVQDLAAVAYRTGGLSTFSALLDADSPNAVLDWAATLNAVASNENTQVRELIKARDGAAKATIAIDAEIGKQKRQMQIMADRKKQAEKALSTVGGQPSSGPSGSSAQARPARRNSDGSWPSESCSLNDPTTSGCITPRTLHALQQAKAAGFTRYVSCYRSGGSGEHPKGRACDFAAQVGGFGGAATGGDRTYGDRLATYFINNAWRLGVLYVIWYRRIWLPSSGWRAYGGSGSPSAEHTNHVHLSVY